MTTPIPTGITPRELKLLEALQDIVMETMAYPLNYPLSSSSHLPEHMVIKGQRALALYGLELPETKQAQQVAA